MDRDPFEVGLGNRLGRKPKQYIYPLGMDGFSFALAYGIYETVIDSEVIMSNVVPF